MTIYVILCEQEDYVNIANFMELKKDYFKELLGVEQTPSHDCLSDLYGNQQIEYKKTINKDYGRNEIREYFLSYNIEKIREK